MGMRKLELGMPVVLVSDVVEKGKVVLASGTKGAVNSLVNIENIDYVFFMPRGVQKSYVIKQSRVEPDEEEIEKLLGSKESE